MPSPKTEFKGNVRHSGSYGPVKGYNSKQRYINVNRYTSIPLKFFFGKTWAQKAYSRGYSQTMIAQQTEGDVFAQNVSRVFAAQVQHRFQERHDAKKSNQHTAFKTAMSGLQGSVNALKDLNINIIILLYSFYFF